MVKDGGVLAAAVWINPRSATGLRAAAITIVYRIYGER